MRGHVHGSESMSLSLYIAFFPAAFFKIKLFLWCKNKGTLLYNNQSLWHIKAKEDRKQMTEWYYRKKKKGKENRLCVQFHTWREWRERDGKRERGERGQEQSICERMRWRNAVREREREQCENTGSHQSVIIYSVRP